MTWRRSPLPSRPPGRTLATRAATRLCASNMKPKQAQRFYSLVLLPAVQDDIAAHKRLNFHFDLALTKAL